MKNEIQSKRSPIGVFDSGYGGLTILADMRKQLPEYDFMYFGDNARAPYGPRSFEVVYEFTLQAVRYLFSQGCELVILACNTASAKALRSIQQNILPIEFPDKRVLGVIRPSTEFINEQTKTGHIGILATDGTVKSKSYVLEIQKYFPQITVQQQACPIWVPLIENNKHEKVAGQSMISEDVQALLESDPLIDTLILGCTHYPILYPFLRKIVPGHIKIISQGPIVANRLKDYLERHPEMDQRISKKGEIYYFTSENSLDFDVNVRKLLGEEIQSQHVAFNV